LLHLGDRVVVEVGDGGHEHGVGAALDKNIVEMFEFSGVTHETQDGREYGV
jgi:hypothetical protein